MKIKHEQERELISHYEKHPTYYSSVNSKRLPRILKRLGILGGFQKHDTILDLGCGDGRLCKYLSEQYGCTCIGIDYSSKRIERARQSCNENCTFHVGDINYFQDIIQVNQVEAVFMFEVLEHLVCPMQIVKQASSMSFRGLYGSVPVNMPYKAHLQVYETADQVESQLDCNVVFRDFDHFFIHTTQKIQS